MGDFFIPFLLVILFLAAFLREDFVLTVGYLLVGAFTLGRWWSRKALSAISVERVFADRAFLGETVRVQLKVSNTGWLPVIWLQVHENIPLGLAFPNVFQQVVALPPRGKKQFEYILEGRRRGYYPIGPLNLYSGDVLGVVEKAWSGREPQYLTVYPKIVPLTRLKIPSRSPLGTLRHTQPIFEDPTRVRGKRDYVAGDSLRRVDWKASAAAGRMQVKQFEPSIALETAIFLNLNAEEYDLRSRFDAPELGIVVAASLASWVIGQRQSAGLFTNGMDPLLAGASPPAVPSRRGRAHLMRILDVLARVEAGETSPFVKLIRREYVNLSWGTTLLLITSQAGDDLFDALFQTRRAGMNILLILVGQVAAYREIRRRAEFFGFPLFIISQERDLDIWRQ